MLTFLGLRSILRFTSCCSICSHLGVSCDNFLGCGWFALTKIEACTSESQRCKHELLMFKPITSHNLAEYLDVTDLAKMANSGIHFGIME